MNSYIREANNLINGERNEAYGPMKESFEGIGQMWSVILRRKLFKECTITAEDVCMCMSALKLARNGFSHKDDNIIDMIGYGEILGKIREESRQLELPF